MDDKDAVALAQDLIGAHADLQVRLLRSEQLNAELARMLSRLEWNRELLDVAERCPVCLAMKIGTNHDPDCALADLLKKATAE